MTVRRDKLGRKQGVRGRARDHMQLSQQQRDILAWLGQRKRHITQNGRCMGGNYAKWGVRWSSTRFLKWNGPKYSNSNSKPPTSASLSRSIRKLAERGLIDRAKGKTRTLYIKITDKGHYAIDPETVASERVQRIERAVKYSPKFSRM